MSESEHDPASAAAAEMNRIRWSKDPEGLDRHIRAVVRRAPLLTEKQIAVLRAALASVDGGDA